MPPKPSLKQTQLVRWFKPVERARPSPPPLPDTPAPPASNSSSSSHDSSSSKSDSSDAAEEDEGGSEYVAALPVELWTAVARLLGRAGVKELARTSRMFRDICLPVLFETITIGWHARMDGLLAIAQSDQLAGLVRDVNVNCATSWEETSSLLAACVPHLRSLVTLSLLPRLYAPLSHGLQLAVITHPTLRNFCYRQWTHASNDLRPSFPRVRSHPLVIDKVGCAYPEDEPAYITSPLDGFFEKMSTYLAHFGLQVRSFHLTLEGRLGPVEPALAKLVSTPLPGLEELRLSCEGKNSYPAQLQSGDWLSRFLNANSSVTRIVIDIGDDINEDFPGSHIYLPLEALGLVAQVNRPSSAALQEWCNETALAEMDIGFHRSASSGAWDVVGLELTRINCFECEHDYELEPHVVGDLAAKFPAIRTLRFTNFFDTGYSLSDSVAPFALFPRLEHLTFPSDFLKVGPDFCWHTAEQLEDDLASAKARWTEEEEWARQDVFGSSFIEDCDPAELEAKRQLWESTSDDKDYDPDDELYIRLLSSGLLRKRPTVRQCVRETQALWISVATEVPTLKTIDWEFHQRRWDHIGTIRWTVVRDVDAKGNQRVSLHEASPDKDLDDPFCRCNYGEVEVWELEEHLESMPPLFEQDADFTPAFMLDRFVSRS